ncbi:unnamed protein product, partial [Heterosigma akashiwo]
TSEYLDISSLECILCQDDSDNTGFNDNKTPDLEDVDENGNPLSCVCETGYREDYTVCSDASMVTGSCTGFTCVSCDPRSAFSDGSSCSVCSNETTLGYDSTAMECSCPVDGDGLPYALIEVGLDGGALNKTCVKCADGLMVIQEDITEAGVAYTADPYTCQACPDEHMYWTASGTCACRSGYTLAGTEAIGETYCLDDDRVATVATGWPLADAIELDYYSVQEVPGEAADGTVSLDSLTVQHHYLRAAAGCYAYRGPEDLAACQALANLCVLADYDREHTTCELFEEVADARSGSSWSQDGWTASLPWLYYADPRATVLADRNIEMAMSFDAYEGKYHELTYVLAAYALNGTFLGLRTLGTDFYYCGMAAPDTDAGGGTNSPTGFLKFGHATTQTFRCDLETLIGQEPVFFDPYVVDQERGYLYPVAVLSTNLREDAGLSSTPNVNAGLDDEVDDVLTRRFFLHDAASGVSASSEADAASGALVPEVLRYASDLTLRVQIQDADPERIYPPLLMVTYRERKPASWDSADADYAALRYATVTFRAEYTMDTDEFWKGVGVLRDLHRGLCGPDALAVAELPAAEHAAGRHGPGGQRADLQGRRALRGGHVPQLRGDLLPCHVLHLLLLVHVLQAPGHGVQHAAAQQPRIWAGQRVLRVYRRVELPLGVPLYLDGERHLPAVDRGHLLHRLGDALRAEGHQEGPQRGGRRGLSVAPRCCARTGGTNAMLPPGAGFNLFWVAFFLVALGLQYNATPQPSLGDLTEDTLNPVLRFANAVWWWVLMAFVQWLWNFLVFERCVTEPKPWRYVDLCTMAKVSVLVLDEPYHGYYLHCRSPHPAADVPLKQLADYLANEALGHRVDRGLE